MHRRPPALVAATSVALLALGLAGCGGSAKATATPAGDGSAGARTTAPPWDLPADPGAAVRAAGLTMLGAEGTALHFHAHLDILADGKPVAVPAGIALDPLAQKVSPLHTHDETGVIHVESPEQATFTLGQLFTEWQVRLTSSCLGGLCAGDGKTLRTYVGGAPYTGDPAALQLAAHQEIELVYGAADAPVTPIAGYEFTNGL